ncbi:MAG TPA: adenylate/guanylate cyclase domain-containing protein [Actinomycetota bacterium]|nr:adenylate/guanylate cyclase domain-containing protein [Actinomycetota bacterium]
MSSPATAGGAPTGTVTFLFTDIEGSTRLLHRLGDGYHALLDDHHRLIRASVRDGFVAGTEGDAFFVVFRSPVDAVHAAIAAQRAIGAHPWPDGVDLRVRMGVHTGNAAIAGGDYVGIDVNRTARIAAAAHGGQILVSATTRDLVLGGVASDVGFRDVGEHRLKDLPEPVHLFQIECPDLPAAFPPPRSAGARRDLLPTMLTSFIGREDIVDELVRSARAHRLVTLTGPGGTGKTRLALEVAERLRSEIRDGAAFVPLATIVEAELVPEVIGRTLGFVQEQGRPFVDTLLERLADARLVLVLDNFEHVIDAAPVVSALLAAASDLRIIVTTRESLRVDGEHEYPVPPMAVPGDALASEPSGLLSYESVALFVDRATAVDPRFVLDGSNAAAVARICTQLDGLPLAIELAAARVRLFTPGQIVDRLDRALSVLRGGGRDRPARQQTLEGAIAWSYDLLDEAERRVFRRMAVFRGGGTFEAAERVCRTDADSDVTGLLGSLVDKSLLRLSRSDDEPRFAFLYVIRGFARDRLNASDDAEDAYRLHAETYLDLVVDVAPKLFGSEQPMWLDRLEREHDNIRAALDWATASGATVVGLRLIAASWRFWQMRGHLAEARDRADSVLAMPDADAHPVELADACEAAGGIAYWMGDWAAGRDRYDRSLELRRSLGDRLGIAEAAYNRACISIYGPPPFRSVDVAARLLDEALAVYRSEDDRLGLAKVLWASGGNLIDSRTADSIAPFRESLQLYRDLGDRFGEAWALHMLGLAEAITGAVDDGERHMRASLDIFLDADDRSAMSILLNDFAVLAVQRGRYERALRLHGAAEAIEARTGVGLGVTATDVGGSLQRMWEALPRDEAERHHAAGLEMSVDEAIAFATKREG